jgi:hypothetical protein
MYQIHYTLDNNLLSYETACNIFKSEDKILQHYNITPSGVKHYELLTSCNTSEHNLVHLANQFVIRTKVETTDKPNKYLYVERHYKTNTLFTNLHSSIMLAEVINPTTHKYVLTLRARTLDDLSKLYQHLPSEIYDGKYSQEFCIYDNYEDLDYLHT